MTPTRERDRYRAVRRSTAVAWTDEEIRAGVVELAADVVAVEVTGQPFTSGSAVYEEYDADAFRAREPWRGVRVSIVRVRGESSEDCERARRAIANLQRETLVLVVLPGTESSFADDVLPSETLDTVCAISPLDVDVLATGETTVAELFDFKLARRVFHGAAASETQLAAGVASDYRRSSQDPGVIMRPVDAVVHRRGEDPGAWVRPATLAQLTRRLVGRRGAVLIGTSGSGKSVLALQLLRTMEPLGVASAVIELSSLSEPVFGLAEPLVFASEFGTSDAIILIDDAQSHPSMAEYLLRLLSVSRRVRAVGSVVAVCTTWPEFGTRVIESYDGCYPHVVEAGQVADLVIAARAPRLDGTSRTLLRERFGDDLGILRVACDMAASGDRDPQVRDVAAELWNAKMRSLNLPAAVCESIALVCGSLSRYDLPASLDLITMLTTATTADVLSATPSLLRPLGSGYSLGHRSTSGLMVEWLGAKGAWNSPHVREVQSSDDVVLEHLRRLSPAAAVEVLRGLKVRLGFRPEAQLARRASAVVQIWEAFSTVVERVEHQQAIDPTWGSQPASAMFAAKALYYVGKRDAARPSLQFLRSHWSIDPDGALEIAAADLATNADFASIGSRMRDEDRMDPQRWSDHPADAVDLDHFHRTWLAGVLLTAEALDPTDRCRDLVHGVETLAGADGEFYPARAAWCTARVLLGLAACGRSVHNSDSVAASTEWLLRPRTRGGACMNGVWPSGTGVWNSQLETTAMVLMALVAAGVDPADTRLATARNYILSMKPNWTAPGQELDGALAAQAYLEAGGDWADVAESASMLSRWAQGEAFWQSATTSAQDSLAQGCRVAQIASHLVDIGWRAIASDLPAFLEALAPPDAFRRELLEEAAPPPPSRVEGVPARASETLTSATDDLCDFLSSLDTLRLGDLVVVGSYRRFDSVGRQQLRSHAREIMRQVSAIGEWHKTFLVWAPPGTGKSHFVSELARAHPGIHYVTLNLAALDGDSWRARIREITDSAGPPTLCLVDEIDARPEEKWPYDDLLPLLDLSTRRQITFVLCGSSGDGRESLVRMIQDRPKGNDLVDRIPARQRLEIPGAELGDRLLIFVSAIVDRRAEPSEFEVEKLALYYVLSRADMRTPRQIGDFAVEVLSRLPADQNTVYYDNLFSPGDGENQRFYVQHLPVALALQQQFLRVLA